LAQDSDLANWCFAVSTANSRKMSDSIKSPQDQFQQWSDLEVISLEHPEDALELFDSEADGIGSMSRPAFPFWSVALVALVAVVAGAFVGAGIANRKGTVSSDTTPQPPAAVTALASAPHVAVKLSLPFRSTTDAVQPNVVVDARRDVSAPVAVARQRVAVRPARARAATTMTKATDTAPTPAADVATLPIDAGPTLVADEDTSPRPVTRVAPVAESIDPAPSAPFQLSVAASASDPDGDVLTYRWSAPTGSFANADASRTTFTCPGTPVEVPLTVTVTDRHGGSATDTVIVRCVAAARENSR
jgi:hypothetical protein